MGHNVHLFPSQASELEQANPTNPAGSTFFQIFPPNFDHWTCKLEVTWKISSSYPSCLLSRPIDLHALAPSMGRNLKLLLSLLAFRQLKNFLLTRYRGELDLIFPWELSEKLSWTFWIYAELTTYWVGRSHYPLYKWDEHWQGSRSWLKPLWL